MRPMVQCRHCCKSIDFDKDETIWVHSATREESCGLMAQPCQSHPSPGDEVLNLAAQLKCDYCWAAPCERCLTYDHGELPNRRFHKARLEKAASIINKRRNEQREAGRAVGRKRQIRI